MVNKACSPHDFSRKTVCFGELYPKVSLLTATRFKLKMFLKLNHQKLDVYLFSRQFVFECYRLTKILPSEEKFGMVSQIRRAALSVHLNIAEGASRKSPAERKRYYEIARGSIVEIDAALDVAKDLGYLENYDLEKLGLAMVKTFKILTGLIN
jgi:four helix bundle protein